jgi:hypothetical protein
MIFPRKFSNNHDLDGGEGRLPGILAREGFPRGAVSPSVG